MKHLLKLLSPFAPDQSGAVSVLYELGGLIVICDAGGCAGNVCGFDEPRWFEKKSAVFSAGLRDMDAILGRDDKLIEKTAKAVTQTDVQFTGIIGTPVPAVIATDFLALKRMAEKKTNLPCITVDCTGTRLYDEGEEKAFDSLFRTFATEKSPVENGRVGVIGCTPLDTGLVKNNRIKDGFDAKNLVCYGMGCTLDDVKKAPSCEKNIVISPSGIKAAKYLKEKFSTPYEVKYPFIPQNAHEKICDFEGKKILIIHQQVLANTLREMLLQKHNASCTVATFFMLDKELAQKGDLHIADEEQLIEIVENGGYDIIIADKLIKRPLKSFCGQFVDLPHFAVSGRLEEEGGQKCHL